MSRELLPNVVVGGVRKCGTTSFFDWLSSHPNVCGSSEKETMFLMDPDSPYYRPESNVREQGPSGYARYFEHFSGETILLEATTRYIYQETARSYLSSMRQPPHVVFLLREPSARLKSAYRYAINNRASLRPDVSFEEFIHHLEEGRPEKLFQFDADSIAGRAYGKEFSEIKDELRYGHYVDQLAPWRRAIPEDRLHVLLFEDLKERPRELMKSFACKIGIDPDYFDDYEFVPKNQTVAVRHLGLQRLVRGLAPIVPRTKLTRTIYERYLSFQSAKASTASAVDLTLERLRAYYRPYNERLSADFSLDLSAWN